MLTSLEQRFYQFFLIGGGTLLLFFRGILEFRFSRNELRRLSRQMVIVGWETLPLALLIGLFTGMTVALGSGIVLNDFRQQNWIAAVVSESIIKEMGPVITAFIVAARVGAAMTAELGTMSVNEEISVLRVLGIHTDRYLVMPRVVASIIMTPALTAYSVVLGLLGGALISMTYFNVPWVIYKRMSFEYITFDEIWKGVLLKPFVFGAIYSSVCCYKGVTTEGGAEGVGKSTTSAVVLSLAGILVANYLLTRFAFGT
jgi:phospholipid/cholesterol/gamma-HCH transport system permease protein